MGNNLRQEKKENRWRYYHNRNPIYYCIFAFISLGIGTFLIQYTRGYLQTIEQNKRLRELESAVVLSRRAKLACEIYLQKPDDEMLKIIEKLTYSYQVSEQVIAEIRPLARISLSDNNRLILIIARYHYHTKNFSTAFSLLEQVNNIIQLRFCDKLRLFRCCISQNQFEKAFLLFPDLAPVMPEIRLELLAKILDKNHWLYHYLVAETAVSISRSIISSDSAGKFIEILMNEKPEMAYHLLTTTLIYHTDNPKREQCRVTLTKQKLKAIASLLHKDKHAIEKLTPHGDLWGNPIRRTDKSLISLGADGKAGGKKFQADIIHSFK